MDWLKTVLPTLATALGGPLAGAAAMFVADKMGMSESTVDAVKAVVTGATPEQLVQLKTIDADLQKFFASLGIRIEEVAAADRANARDMLKVTRSWVPAALSAGVTAGYFSVLVGMMAGLLKLDDSQALLLMLGSLTTAWGMVMAFWFGNTRSSEDKTMLLAKADPINVRR